MFLWHTVNTKVFILGKSFQRKNANLYAEKENTSFPVPSLAIILNYKYTNWVVHNFLAGNECDRDANTKSQQYVQI